MIVIEHNAHPLLLDEVSTLFVGCALSTFDMNSVYVCVCITEPDVIGETGVEVERGNEVLDECEEEDEDGGAFVLEQNEVDEAGGVWQWCRQRRTGDPMFRSVDSHKTRELELVEVK